MTWRTPSSLKWLIDKRSRLAGRLVWTEERLQRVRRRLQQLEEDLAATSKRLDAIDIAIGIHEIQIDPTELSATRPAENGYLLPHGHLGRILRRELRVRDGWVDTRKLAQVVFDHLNTLGRPTDFTYVMHVVRNRLNGFYHRGSVIRHVPMNDKGQTNGMTLALWSLPGREAPDHFGQRIIQPGGPRTASRRA